MTDTYSFTDISCVLSHPAVGQLICNGEGRGDIAISYANDMTAHLLSNDGVVTPTKIEASNGTITINTSQMGEIHRYLSKLANYIRVSRASEWARLTITIKAQNLQTTCKGVSPQKIPDETYGQQAQNVAWALMAAKINREPI